MRKAVLAGLGVAALLSGCAEFGGGLGGGPPSPHERRLQDIEARLDELARQVENLTLAAQGQSLPRLEEEVRALNGAVERLRYELETGGRRSRELYQDLDRRLARLEQEGGARLSMDSRIAAPPPVPAEQEEEATYAAVFYQLRARKYDQSIAGFRQLLERWPQGRYAANAWYWLGESHYAKKDFDAALESFRTLLAQFPASPKAPDALFKIGVCQAEKKQRDAARASWQRVIAEFPDSSAAGLARERLDQPKAP